MTTTQTIIMAVFGALIALIALLHYRNGKKAECDATVSISGTKKSPESETMVGWVVKENGDIGFYKEEPYFDEGWFGGFQGFLPQSLFSILPPDSPRKVRITITPIEE